MYRGEGGGRRTREEDKEDMWEGMEGMFVIGEGGGRGGKLCNKRRRGKGRILMERKGNEGV